MSYHSSAKQIRALLHRNWLGCTTAPLRHWNSSIPCVSADWVLLLVRMLPLVLLCIFDTAVFYQVCDRVQACMGGALWVLVVRASSSLPDLWKDVSSRVV